MAMPAAALAGALAHHHAPVPGDSYTVRPGDTLSGIAQQAYGKAGEWRWLATANRARVANPNEIYPDEEIEVPLHEPASTASYTYQPRHARPEAPAVTSVVRRAGLSGTLGCGGLETLWESAGGSSGEAVTAASVAMAESGGNQYALSPTDDRGYWQINASHGALSTYDAMGNARAAVIISGDGADWAPWSTYTSGAYSGRC
jgi:hypothetical protein